LQVTLCDLCLSTLSVRYYKKCAVQIHLPLTFYLLLQSADVHWSTEWAGAWPQLAGVMDTDCIWSYKYSRWYLECQVSGAVGSTDEASAGQLPLCLFASCCLYIGWQLGLVVT